MKLHIWKLLAVCLLVVLLPLALADKTRAYEAPEDFSHMTLDEAVAEFRQLHGLTEENFSISYYNTVTGESYAWNDSWFAHGASTYKLPLNMYFYEMRQTGEITGDTVISWTGQTLDTIQRKSIVESNNELSEALMYYWGDNAVYKKNIRKYFSMPDEELDYRYWQDNWFCTGMMMDCLKYLYENQDRFEELIGHMKQAMPDQYFKRGVTSYEVAHKYGSLQGCNNDVGIIYTPQPFLLAVYSQGQNVGADGVCANAAALMTSYTLWQELQSAAEVPEEPAAEEIAPQEAVPERIPAEQPEKLPAAEPDWNTTATRDRSDMATAAGVIAAATLLMLLLFYRRKKR